MRSRCRSPRCSHHNLGCSCRHDRRTNSSFRRKTSICPRRSRCCSRRRSHSLRRTPHSRFSCSPCIVGPFHHSPRCIRRSRTRSCLCHSRRCSLRCSPRSIALQTRQDDGAHRRTHHHSFVGIVSCHSTTHTHRHMCTQQHTSELAGWACATQAGPCVHDVHTSTNPTQMERVLCLRTTT